MTKLAKAARALLAHWDTSAWKYLKPTGDLMADLREALAEQAEQEHDGHWSDCSVHNEPAYPNGKCDCGGYTEAEQKPAAYLSDLNSPQPHAVTDLKYCSWAQHERGDHLKYVPVYAAPVQQVTRADLKAAFKEGFERAADLYAPNDGQEPYAYEVWDANDQVLVLIYASCLKEFYWIEQDDIARKLYTHPVRTKDLTDDEIYPLYPEGPMCDKDMIDFARAVIAKFKEKNK